MAGTKPTGDRKGTVEAGSVKKDLGRTDGPRLTGWRREKVMEAERARWLCGAWV